MARVARATAEAMRDEKEINVARIALADLCAALEIHIGFEEQTLVPYLENPSALAKEHAGQRAVLQAILEDAAVGVRPTEELTDEIAWFLRGLERDMEIEERLLLVDPALM